MATDWNARLAEHWQTIARRAARAAEVLHTLGPWLRRYRGGAPIGFLAAIAEWESGGTMSSSGDERLGEVGYFQVTESFPRSVGVSPNLRRDPEGNVWLGALEYNLEAIRQARNSAFVSLGSADSWKLARLGFAIGSAGTRKLVSQSMPRFGQVFRAVQELMEHTGGIALGSQSAGKVWYRVHAVALQWRIGEMIAPLQHVGAPTRSPAPADITPTVPRDLARDLAPRWRSPLAVAGTSVIAGLLTTLHKRTLP